MTPDEIQKDRETPSTSWAVWAWQAYRDGALVDPATLTAGNAALKERVLVLTYALDIWEAAYSTGRNEPLVTASETGRAALEKSHE